MAQAISGSCSLKRLGVFLAPLPPIAGLPPPPPALNSLVLVYMYTPGRRHCESKISCPRTQNLLQQDPLSRNEIIFIFNWWKDNNLTRTTLSLTAKENMHILQTICTAQVPFQKASEDFVTFLPAFVLVAAALSTVNKRYYT